MSTCGISANLASTDCKNALVGGIDKVYVTERDNITAFTESTSQITAITMAAGTYFYEVEPVPDTAFTTSNKAEGNITRYDNQLEFRFAVASNSDLDKIRQLPGKTKYAVVYLNNDGTYRCLGIGETGNSSRGLSCTIIENTQGAAFDANEGVRVVFAGADTSGELFWDNASEDIAALLDPSA